MSHLKWFAVAIAAIVAAAGLATAAWWISSNIERSDRQATFDPFYEPPDPLPAEPGTVIRTEPLDVDVPGGQAYRMLYVSERPDGTPAASGGMVFIPDTPAPPEGRPVVAWAHGTVGMGDACAPSRAANPLGDTDNWLDQMMSLGWVVTATDYVGLGTPGPELYLVKEAEVRDVVNSVRAARNLTDTQAGADYVVWGHSQGGHSSLWSGHLAPELAPELNLAIALTYIYGVGRSQAAKALEATGVDPEMKSKDLTDDQTLALRDWIEANLKVEGDLRREVAADVRRKVEIGCYQGIRHRKGLPVRGQRTHTNARTRKGPRKTVAGKKKA